MKRFIVLSLLLLALPLGVMAQVPSADSVDVLDYDVYVDLSGGRPFAGDATLTVRLTAPCSRLRLALHGTADSVWVDGTQVTDFTSQSLEVGIPLSAATGDTVAVRVCYHGDGFVESYGWGGFHFDNDMSYNLGVGFVTDPHSIGSALVPCRDNFHDKATFTLRVHTRPGWSAECGGMLQSRETADDGTELSVWRIAHPVSIYLVSVSQSAWRRIHTSVASVNGTYPLTLSWLQGDSAYVRRAFAELDSVVPMFERCMGPYRWERIGYIATQKGSMEHVNNIALTKDFMTSTAERAQMTIAHELGHAWFGNLVTCRTEADMWFNEGGASFTSELAMEGAKGRTAAEKYYQTNLEKVLREAHITDNGYRPLSPMPHDYTYGTTTYDKGALVWHSLRGLLGRETFYDALNRLFADKAFGTVDALEVRDSLMSYTGVDLTDFFDFHVFGTGFVDYHVALTATNPPAVVIRQQGVGTTAVPCSGRVPVTFFGADGSATKAWFPIDSTGGGGQLNTGNATWCVLDYDMELSDAATVATFRRGSTSAYKAAHIKFSGPLPEEAPLVVEHHWGHPWDIDTLTGLRRTANRWWAIRGAESVYEGLQGQFRYVRSGYHNGDFPYLDIGLFNTSQALDSMAVLYREGYGHPWQSVAYRRSGNNNEGYFLVDNLRPGEYTLAVIDTALLSITTSAFNPQNLQLDLFPNPVEQGESLTLRVPVEGTFTVRVFDAAGREVWHKRGCRDGRRISPRLASGTYLVRIENNFVSLQSKLIVL